MIHKARPLPIVCAFHRLIPIHAGLYFETTLCFFRSCRQTALSLGGRPPVAPEVKQIAATRASTFTFKILYFILKYLLSTELLLSSPRK
jgi:hypothetical protein